MWRQYFADPKAFFNTAIEVADEQLRSATPDKRFANLSLVGRNLGLLGVTVPCR